MADERGWVKLKTITMVAAQALAANDMVSTQRQPLNTAWGHFFVFARKTD